MARLTLVLAAGEPDVVLGRYVEVATEFSLPARDQAIEAAVAHFFLLARPIARARLEEKNARISWFELSASGEDVVLQLPQRPLIRGRSGQVREWVSPEGERVKVECARGPAELVLRLLADGGVKQHRFSWRPDGVVVLEVTVTSPQLAAPLVYAAAYRLGSTVEKERFPRR